MGIYASWDNEHETTLRYTLDRVWTWEEFFTTLGEGKVWIDERGQPVDVIFDTPPDVQVAPNFITHASRAFRARHPLVRTVVVIGGNAFSRTLISAFAKVMRGSAQSFFIVASLDDARALIEARRAQTVEAI